MLPSDPITKKPKWIGVDFDETLRRYDGTPVKAMVARVKNWIAQGIEVRIVTARVNEVWDDQREARNWDKSGVEEQRKFVADWCEEQFGVRLKVQWGKSAGMLELWDDKVVRIEANTGLRLSPSGMEYDDPCNRCGSMVKCDHDE